MNGKAPAHSPFGAPGWWLLLSGLLMAIGLAAAAITWLARLALPPPDAPFRFPTPIARIADETAHVAPRER